jgi:ketosteroid isomerase-like protein
MDSPRMDTHRVTEIIRRNYDAFYAQDRNAAESLLSDDFTFTSPLDDHIGKAQFFERCWPHNDKLRDFRIEKLFVTGDEAFVRYRCVRRADGVTFRNAEYLRLEEGRIKEVQVFFGAEDGVPGANE